MTLTEWQQRVHALNREKGFYDYEDDLAQLEHTLDRIYRSAEFEGFGGDTPVTITIDLATYWAIARVATDYRQAMLERKLLLVIGELCEAHEELRSGRHPNEVYTVMSNGDKWVHTGPTTVPPGEKPEGFLIEVADAAIRTLDVLQSQELELEPAMELKHRYNETRAYKHGRAF